MEKQILKEQLNAIYTNLNAIEVKGESNLGLLYGAMNLVKGLYSEIDKLNDVANTESL